MAQMTITQFMTGIKNWVLGKIGNITALIPSQASSSNQLADKAFVNSSIATATATFRGTYNVVSDLSLSYNATHAQIQTALATKMSALSITPDNNDYAFVQIPTADDTPTQIAKIERYKYSGSAWAFEYELNNSGFTAAQWAAINSGITGTKVTKLDALPTNAELTALLAGKQNVLTFDDAPTENSDNPVKSGGIYSAIATAITNATNAIKDWANGIFAKIDGYYETMGVGTADNLTGQTERTDDAMYRKSGGIEEVVTGTAEITNIKGKTVAWNQLCSKVVAGTDTTGTTIEHGIKLTSQSLYVQLRQFISSIPTIGHKYYCTFYSIPISKGIQDYISLNGKVFGTSIQGRNIPFGKFSCIFELQSNPSANFVGYTCICKNQEETMPLEVDFINNAIIDLTLIYGAGNEPSTVAQFEADYFKWFGKPLAYEEYDAGSLRSVQLDAIKTTGFNQWDEEWEHGKYNPYSGVQQWSNENIRSKNYIGFLEGKPYYIASPSSSITYVVCYYDNQKKFLGSGFHFGNSIFPNTSNPQPKGAKYIRFYVEATYGATYNHDICINISNPSKNGEYEPYEEHVAPLPVTTLTGKLNGEGESVTIFPDGMRSAGTIADEIYTAGDKTYAVKRVGSVDLGDLNYNYAYGRDDARFFKSINILSNGNGAWNNTQKRSCGKYITTCSSDDIYAGYIDKGIILDGENKIRCSDSSYTSGDDFKIAVQGVMFYYELATPLVYEVEGFTLPKTYLVDNGGTEEQVQKANVQGLAAILTCIYGVDAVGILDKLPRNYISEASMDNFLAELSIATGGTWTKTWNDNSGEWDFSFTPNAQTDNTNIEETI